MQNFLNRIYQSKVLSLLIICLCGAFVYSFMLGAPFKTLDDNFSIVNNEFIQDIGNIKNIFSSSFFSSGHYYRPLVSLSFMLEYHFFGLNPFYYNLTNMLLHLVMAVVVFFLISMILKDRKIGFWVGLLFAIHPVHWESVANIPGRAILLSALFGIIAFLCFIQMEKKKSILLYILSLFSFGLSLLSKESGAMVPVVLGAYLVWIVKPQGLKSWGEKLVKLFPYFSMIAAYILLRKSFGVIDTYPWRTISEYVLGFFTFLRSCFTHLRMFVLPVDLHFDRSQQLFLNYIHPEFLLTVSAVGIGMFFLISQWRKINPVILFFSAWACIDLVPVSQMITTIGVQPGYISTADHFLYTPSIGIFVLMVLGVCKFFDLNNQKDWISSSVAQFAIGSLVIFFILTSVQLNLHAKSAIAMFERSIHFQPNNSRMLYSLGIEYGIRGYPKKAEQYFRRSLVFEPRQPTARVGLGKALCDQGKYWKGIQEYEKVVNSKKYEKLLKKNLAAAYQSLIDRYQKRLETEKNNATLYYSLGVMYSKTERLKEAIDQYQKALVVDSTHEHARFNLDSLKGFLGGEK